MRNSHNRKANESTSEQPIDKAGKVEKLGNIVLPDAFTALFDAPLVDSEMKRLISINEAPIYDNDKLENPTYDQVVQQLGLSPLAQ